MRYNVLRMPDNRDSGSIRLPLQSLKPAPAAGHTQTLTRELAGGVGDECKRVGHLRSLPALHARGLNLAKEQFELIDGAPEA